jgi:phosphoglycerol transferase MdoB-like AlkP superfamily enzyme
MTLQGIGPAKLKNLLISRYLLFPLILVALTEILQHYGALPSLRPAWRFEIPLLCYLYWLANRVTRPNRLQPLIAALPILVLYGIFDFYHLRLGRLLRLTEVTELPEMFQVVPLSFKLLSAAMVGLPLLIFLLALHWRRLTGALAGSLPLLVLAGSILFCPDRFVAAFKEIQQPLVFYSDTRSAALNGRLSMLLYNEARRRSAIEKTSGYRDNARFQEKFSHLTGLVQKQKVKPNVHVVVLESFFDPTLLKKAKFSQNPTHPDFAALFAGKGSLSISPVFGGGTAQAEFEVLCGVPAMQELSGVEFNMFTGSKTLCLPQILAEGGYQTLATNAFVPEFYNSTNAYTGMGFADIYYPKEYVPSGESYFGTGDVTGETYMFDGELLSQNLDFIARRLKEPTDRPIFNYVISMYGHLPHDINLEKRPRRVRLESDFYDEQLERAVNQYYYRTQAIAAFVRGLTRLDPKSLIILVSDHLPPFAYGPDTYRNLDYLGGVEKDIHLNRVFFIENGKAVPYRTIHHYDLPKVVLNYVTGGQYCGTGDCGFNAVEADGSTAAYQEEYLTIMARAML